jgi:hypothetical protein
MKSLTKKRIFLITVGILFGLTTVFMAWFTWKISRLEQIQLPIRIVMSTAWGIVSTLSGMIAITGMISTENELDRNFKWPRFIL